MPKNMQKLRLENSRIKLILGEIERFSGINFSLSIMKRLLYSLKHLWNSQERKEKQWLKKEKIEWPIEFKFINEHKELKGHWFVLQQALKSGDKSKLRIALDTDGRMLLEKTKNHINEKERLFQYFANRNSS